MKTCPNPNCKTTGIPDEAIFCPICGQLLLRKSTTFSQTYIELSHKREQLLKEKTEFETFEQQRQQLLNVLNKDEMFLRERKHTIFVVIIGSICITIGLLYFAAFWIVIAMLDNTTTLTWWEIVVLCGGGIPVLLLVTGGQLFIKIKIPVLFKPFLDGNMIYYRRLLAGKSSVDKMWKSEALHPHKISAAIQNHIKKLESRIADIDIQLENIKHIAII